MTAIQRLENELLQFNFTDGQKLVLTILLNQAIELEKQQIKNAYNQGYRDGGDVLSGKDISLFDDANLYYNETYKKP
jgi:hypothetical protein